MSDKPVDRMAQAGYERRKCSKCGEGLGFTESDPCDNCTDAAPAPATPEGQVPERVWIVRFLDNGEMLPTWDRTAEIRETQPGDFVATRHHEKVEYVRPDSVWDEAIEAATAKRNSIQRESEATNDYEHSASLGCAVEALDEIIAELERRKGQ